MAYLGLVFTILLMTIGSAKAEERIGDLAVGDVFLEPTFAYSENRAGRFEMGDSRASLVWKRDQIFSAHLTVGTRSLLGTPTRYGRTLADEAVAMAEAYAQMESDYGRLRAGLLPIRFGREGGDAENDLYLPRSRFWQRRVLPLRDLGATFSTDNEGFFSILAAHNGEGGRDLDNETWFSTEFGWQDAVTMMAVSATAGRTAPASTGASGVSSADAGMDGNRDARYRFTNFFIQHRDPWFSAGGEVFYGHTVQGEEQTQLLAWVADCKVRLLAWLDFVGRFDQIDPRLDRGGDLLQEGTLGFRMSDRYENSVLSVLASRLHQEGVTQDAHQLRVIWRLTPFIRR